MNQRFLNLTDSGLTWLDLNLFHIAQLCLTWLDLTWLDLTWLDLTWLDLTWLDLTWLDLAWLDLTWLDLTWLDSTQLYSTRLDSTWLDLTWNSLTWFYIHFTENNALNFIHEQTTTWLFHSSANMLFHLQFQTLWIHRTQEKFSPKNFCDFFFNRKGEESSERIFSRLFSSKVDLLLWQLHIKWSFWLLFWVSFLSLRE